MHPQDRLFCEIAVQLNLLSREQVARCMQTQQRDGGGQTIASVATALGLLDQAAVDRVMHQQQRVLERRREARDASRKKREAESRAAAGLPVPATPSEPARAPANSSAPGARVQRPRDPTPTSPWLQGGAPASRLKSEEAMPRAAELLEQAQLDSHEVRETLDVRPPQRSAGRATLREKPAPANDVRPMAAQVTAPLPHARSPELPPEPSRGVSADALRRTISGHGAPPVDPGVRRTGAGHAAPPVDGRAADAARVVRHANADRPSAAGPEPRASAAAAVEHEASADDESWEDLGAELRASLPGGEFRPSAPVADPRAGARGGESRPSAPGAEQPATARGPDARASDPGGPADARSGVDAARAQRRAGASISARDHAAAIAPTAPLDLEAADAQPNRALVQRTVIGTGAALAPEAPAVRVEPASAVPQKAAGGLRGTLLETSGREQQRRQESAAPGKRSHPPRVSARPVPAGRDWRNPSRPPPPSVGLDVEISPLTAAGSQPAPATGNLGSRIKAPVPDTPRYVDRALALCAELGASDLYVCAGALPCLRIDGRLWPLAGEQPLPPAAAERAIAEVLDDAQLMQLSLDGELRCSYQLLDGLRARLHAFVGELGLNLALRVLPAEPPPAERIGLGPALRLLRESPWGLCICSGPAGSGKTTSLWALTRALTAERALHVVSLESPLELKFTSGLGLCEQREVGRHVASYAEGIEWALSEAADVIVVSDLLAPGAFQASLRASRSRCLVLGGVRASSSLGVLSRLLSEPAHEAELLRFELSYALRLLLHQRLLPRARVAGRTAAFEQLINTTQVAQLIRDDKLQQLPAVLAAGKSAGMVTLDDALEELVRSAAITPEAARAVAQKSERFSARNG